MNLLRNLMWQAQYNQTMNRQFYAACEPISDADRKRDLGAFFKSVHGTLNHILLGDKVWLGRIQSQPFAVKSLDQILAHLFLHQTHHRGQLSTLIGQLGYDFGDTDILWSNPLNI